MSIYPVGIDLGTSTSVISFYEGNEAHVIEDPSNTYKSPIVPSMVAMNKKNEIVVGKAAKSFYAEKDCFVQEVKRLMGTEERLRLKGQTFRPEEISAHILTHMAKIASERLGSDIGEVVISVPAYWADAPRSATRHAAEIAGLNVIRLIKEPTAAALAFGVKNLDLEAQIAVFDFGGGTLDISILEMMEGVLDVKVSSGDQELGGKDIDEHLINWMRSDFERKFPNAKLGSRSNGMLKRAAEETKIALSNSQSTSIHIPFFASLNGDPVDYEAEITRTEFNGIISPVLERTRRCLQNCFAMKDVDSLDIEKILLIGGTTYIPAIREIVAEFFGKEPKAEIAPDLAVAQGAAIHAASAMGFLDSERDVILSDIAAFGLGVDVVSFLGGRLGVRYEPLIKPNDKIPYSVKKDYTLLTPDQREVSIRVYQDPSGEAVFPEDAIPTGIEGVIDEIPPALYGQPHPLVVEFSYNIDGEIAVSASIPGLNRECNIKLNASSLRMTDEEVKLARERLVAGARQYQELWRMHPQSSEFVPLIEKAEKLLAQFPPGERSPLVQTVSRVKDALSVGDEEMIRIAKKELVNALFEHEDY